MDNQDLFQQQNKRYNGIREKLKKKWNRKQEIKKEKKIKKQKNKDKEKKKHSKKDKKNKEKDPIQTKKLQKAIKSFIMIFEDDLKDFYSIFESFDKGDKINISQLENLQVKEKLLSIFKYMSLFLECHNEDYFKRKSYNQTKLVSFIQRQVQNIFDKIESSEEQQDSISQQSDFESEQQNHKESLDISLEPQHIEQQNQEIIPQTQIQQSKKQMGPCITKEQREQFLQNALPKQEIQQKSNNADLDAFLMDTFQPIEKKSQLKNFLDTRSKADPQKQNNNQNEDQQNQIRAYIKEYDQKFRPKSLMELHKEKMKGQKKADRQPFNRDKDMDVGRIDSKRLYQTINDKNFSIKSRFSESKFESNFM